MINLKVDGTFNPSTSTVDSAIAEIQSKDVTTITYTSTAGRVSIPLGTVCIYLLIYLIGNFKDEDKLINNKKIAYFLAGCAVVYIYYKAKKTIGFSKDFLYLDKFKTLIAGEIFLVALIGILNVDSKKYRNFTLYFLIAIALVTGLRVNPVIRTTDIFYTKPVAVRMNEIKEENPEAIWAVNDGGWYINDYALASGIRVINSTGVYPNMEFFKEFLGEKASESETRKIYNRYAHIIFNVVSDESEIELLYPDTILVKMNYKDLEKFNIEYILSSVDLYDDFTEDQFEKLYEEDGMYIFKVMKGI